MFYDLLKFVDFTAFLFWFVPEQKYTQVGSKKITDKANWNIKKCIIMEYGKRYLQRKTF